ncbi:MAG: hypothetical protein HN509_02170 [Halobacteriovoraceae bacterium]|jgi:hypothetical protein|nr:hypothetical protein [Halobacteriovoraceae bacterium]MBT5094052.1 hypothetical protein [Halobacteriovoraceae bacterium]
MSFKSFCTLLGFLIFISLNSSYACSSKDFSSCKDPASKQKACREAAAQLHLNCGAAKNSCKYLMGCLERRDSCITPLRVKGKQKSWLPNTKKRCDYFAQCLKANKKKFRNKYGECNYNWAPSRKNKKGPNKCRIYYNMFAYQYTCPGRRDYFDEKRGDKKFNCQDVTDNLNDFEATCAKLKSKYLGSGGCANDDYLKKTVSEIGKVSCDLAKSYRPIPGKKFAVSSNQFVEKTTVPPLAETATKALKVSKRKVQKKKSGGFSKAFLKEWKNNKKLRDSSTNKKYSR